MELLFYLFEIDWQEFFSNPSWIGLPLMFIVIGVGAYFQLKHNTKEDKERALHIKAGGQPVKKNTDKHTKAFLFGLIIIFIVFVFIFFNNLGIF